MNALSTSLSCCFGFVTCSPSVSVDFQHPLHVGLDVLGSGSMELLLVDPDAESPRELTPPVPSFELLVDDVDFVDQRLLLVGVVCIVPHAEALVLLSITDEDVSTLVRQVVDLVLGGELVTDQDRFGFR